jgi:hypothetical protein
LASLTGEAGIGPKPLGRLRRAGVMREEPVERKEQKHGLFARLTDG